MRKNEPDISRIRRLMRTYVKVVAIQTALQFVIIFIMAEFATGSFLKLLRIAFVMVELDV